MANDDEDEYEYEYSVDEIETFYVDLDLSSVNNVLKSQNAGDRRVLRAPQTSAFNASKKSGPSKRAVNQEEDDEQEEEDRVAGGGTPRPDGEDSPAPVDAPRGIDLQESEDGIQILDLHSLNPMISYRNQIYSCQWIDMIGTNMFFTKHNETPLHEPEIATEDFDLVGTSRIKLVGYKATVTAKTSTQPQQQQPSTTRTARQTNDDINDDDGAEVEAIPGRRPSTTNEPDITVYIPPTHNPTSIKRTDPRTQTYTKRQATFLEKLRDIKRQRGEQDQVRTFVDRHTLDAAEKQKEEMTQMRKEIAQLNVRVVKGDTQALERLQEIYSRIDEVESDDEGIRDGGGGGGGGGGGDGNGGAQEPPAT